MAYADYNFYHDTYCGDKLTQEKAAQYLTRASDEIDVYTFNRLANAFPEVESHAVKVKKAVCAVADILYTVDIQRNATMVTTDENGEVKKVVASMSSGRESISYSVNNTAASEYAAAAADTDVLNTLIIGAVSKYLANIPDANGVNLLYAGARGGGYYV